MPVDFEKRNKQFIEEMRADNELFSLTKRWFERASKHEYSYHFSWLGRPIIQFPQDLVAIQELIWRVRPRVIVETGIARGGSIIFCASMLQLLGEGGKVIGVELDLRAENRGPLLTHPLAPSIQIVEGSSIDATTVQKVLNLVGDEEKVLVILDSNHTHSHVAAELESYSHLVRKGSYLVVMDTIIEAMPPEFSLGRPWGPGNSPRTAVDAFLKKNDRFKQDQSIDAKLMITVAPGGYLECVKDPND